MSPLLSSFFPNCILSLGTPQGPNPSTLKRILIPLICFSLLGSFSLNQRVPLVLIAILALGALRQIRSTVLGSF